MGAHYPDREARIDRLERELEAVLTRIVDADTERVILFGSVVRGDVGSTSDLDLLVIRHDARRPAERAADLYARVRPDRRARPAGLHARGDRVAPSDVELPAASARGRTRRL